MLSACEETADAEEDESDVEDTHGDSEDEEFVVGCSADGNPDSAQEISVSMALASALREPFSQADKHHDDAAEATADCDAARLASGMPPGLKRAAPQHSMTLRADRVSVCVAKCRSSAFAVGSAIERLHWEPVPRDTAEVSVSWLEHGDSTAVCCPFQVTSKIDGMLQVCRKVDLALCLQAMQERYPAEYSFVPRTWVISPACADQVADLERTMNERKGWTYVCKPTAGSQGRGVRLVRNFSDLRGPLRDAFPGDRTSTASFDRRGSHDRAQGRGSFAEHVVQRYVSKPLLVDGYKFDCRCYVVITSVVPLRAYLFEEGLARFCTTKYEKPRGRNLSNACMHLTNYAVNKRNDAFGTAQAHDEGSKRSLSSVLALVEAQGGPLAKKLWEEVRTVAEKTLLALRPALVEHISSTATRACCSSHRALHPVGSKGFHILGLDVLFDECYRPVLLETNANSSLSVMQPSGEPHQIMEVGWSEEQESKRRITEVSQLDLAVKGELLSQAMLVSNPLPHGEALRRRIRWHDAGSSSADIAELIPLSDDGQPWPGASSSSTQLGTAIPDQPDRCPALLPLTFERHKASGYVRAHLLAYRIWRYYQMQGSSSLDRSSDARSTGFGQPEFEALCTDAGLVGLQSSDGPQESCWPDASTAREFMINALRTPEAFRLEPGGQEEIPTAENVDEHVSIYNALDFERFLRRIAIPMGGLIKQRVVQSTPAVQATPTVSSATQFADDPLDAFVARVLPSVAMIGSATT